MRERGNIWPILVVVAAALCVLVIVPLFIERQKAGRMATVDAHVSIGDGEMSDGQASAASKYRWPNGEVPRTAERLRDVTAVAIAAATCLVEESLHGRRPRDAGEIITRIDQRKLIANEWQSEQSGVLLTPHATIHLRYSPRDLTVELISVPNERIDGPAILIRIPDSENMAVGNRYFESMQLDGIIYPRPFAPIADIIATGWQPHLFKQTQLADVDRARVEQWANETKRQQPTNEK
jgi:hypothetical protein